MKRYEANRRSGWACDVGYKKIAHCPTGITDFRQGYHLHSWRCQRCDFDLCIGCCLRYRCIDLKKLRPHELSNYFVIVLLVGEGHRLISKFTDIEEAKQVFKKHKAKNKMLIGGKQLLAESSDIPEAERAEKFGRVLEEAQQTGILSMEESKQSDAASSFVYLKSQDGIRTVPFEDKDLARFYFATANELTSRILVQDGGIVGEAGLAFEARQLKAQLSDKKLWELSSEEKRGRGAVYWHQSKYVYKYFG